MDTRILCLELLVIIVCVAGFAQARIYNQPDYPYEYIGVDCVPYKGDTVNDARRWNDRVINMTTPGAKMYGYVKVKPNNEPYDNPCNCAVKIWAPNGYKLVMRIPRIEIYHEDDDCDGNYISIIGDSPETIDLCGYGTVPYSIISTEEWVIVQIKATKWNVKHDYIGVSLYYTALHDSPCNMNANVSEIGCNNHCIPEEVSCDDRDNCGDFDDERASVCGLTQGAIIAISIVSVLVGGALLFFLAYCLYSKHKDKRRQRERRRDVANRTTTVHTANHGGSEGPTVNPGFMGSAEPPPPYTREAYVNGGLYTGNEVMGADGANVTPTSGAGATTLTGVNVTFPAPTGLPPPMYPGDTSSPPAMSDPQGAVGVAPHPAVVNVTTQDGDVRKVPPS